MSKTKGGSLSKAEKFYIANNTGLTDEDLAKDLNRSSQMIKKYRDTLPELEDASLKVADLMARTDKGATTMTEAASMLTDEKKVPAKDKPSVTERSFKSSIHRIKKV
jgi:hypothetical protein